MKVFLLIVKLLIELVARTDLNAEPWVEVFALLLNVYDIGEEIIKKIKKYLIDDHDSDNEDLQDINHNTEQDENL